jgi:hypothetical protein
MGSTASTIRLLTSCSSSPIGVTVTEACMCGRRWALMPQLSKGPNG